MVCLNVIKQCNVLPEKDFSKGTCSESTNLNFDMWPVFLPVSLPIHLNLQLKLPGPRSQSFLNFFKDYHKFKVESFACE